MMNLRAGNVQSRDAGFSRFQDRDRPASHLARSSHGDLAENRRFSASFTLSYFVQESVEGSEPAYPPDGV
jgi:hypothetical protein